MLAAVQVRADTEGRLRSAEARLDQLLDRMEAGNARVEALESEAAVIAGRISEVETRLEQTQASIVQRQQEIEQAKARLQATQENLDSRARAAYEIGSGSSLEFLLGSTSLTDLGDRLEIMDRAAASDEDLINRIEDQKTRLIAKRTALERLKRALLGQRDELLEHRSALMDKLSEAEAVYRSVVEAKADAERLVKELEEKRRQEILEARRERLRQLQLLQEQRGAQGQGGAIAGSFMTCPVDHPHTYIDDFGFPRQGHRHQGNDLFAPYGTPVRAPFPGTAVDSSNGIGGTAVKVYGEGGYVYNAHLSEIGQLGPVEAGTIIGRVGSTGNARGTSPHNHFEWHPGGGDAVNPYPYLNAVC